MKMKKIRYLLFALILLFSAFAFLSCKSEQKKTDKPAIVENNKTSNEIKEPEKSEPVSEANNGLKGTNPLTGLPCKEEIQKNRPVALMINNIKVAIPQLGISQADVLYECTVEGAITRLMAVFLDYASLPTTGSVRSSRDYYIDLAQAHDAIYAHCGGSDIAYSILKARNIDHLDGTNDYLPSTFWRDPERRRKMGLEHSMVTNGQGISEGIQYKKFRTSINEGFTQPLSFQKKDTDITGDTADYVTVPFSSYATSFFEYDQTSKLYKKGQYGEAHIDGNSGEQLTFKNVLLLSAVHSSIAGDAKGRISINFTGSGKGYYVTDGKYKEIVWKKADRETPYALYEVDGTTPLLLNAGKSYIGIVPTTINLTFHK